MASSRKNSSVALAALVGFCLTHAAFAQEEFGRVTAGPVADTLRKPNETMLSFERNLSTYLWNLGLNYQRSSPTWSVDLRQLFRSSLVRVSQKFIKDEEAVSFLVGKKLSDRFDFQLDGSSLVFSDNRAIGIDRASSHSTLVGLRYLVNNVGTISPSIGVRFDNQTGQQDKGVSYRFLTQIGELDISGYRMNFQGRFSGDRITPRKGESHAATLSVEKTFVEQTTDTLRVQFFRNRRDFYFPADSVVAEEFGVTNNIEQRIEEIIDVSNELNYGAGRNLLFTFSGNLRQRGISKNINYKTVSSLTGGLFDTDISEFRLETFIQGRYRSERTSALFRVMFSERDENHEAKSFPGADRLQFESRKRNEARKNNSSRRTALTGNAQFGVTKSNVLSLSAFTSLLRYDTPSAENTDDRDELLLVFSLSDQQSLGKNLSFILSADVVLNHTVYLFASRSANNNWNRVFRLSPRIDTRLGARFKTANTFEVLANYTVYDFEDQVFSVRSFSFRQFSFIDSSTYQLSRRVAFDLAIRLKLYERGQLRWKEFKERPENYFEDRTFFCQFRYSPSAGVSVAVGFRYFSLTRFRYQAQDRVFENRLVNYGPTCMIEWTMKRNARLLLSGWYETQKQTSIPANSFSNLAMTMNFGL